MSQVNHFKSVEQIEKECCFEFSNEDKINKNKLIVDITIRPSASIETITITVINSDTSEVF